MAPVPPAPTTRRPDTAPADGFTVSRGYLLWVLVILVAINAVNFIDRTIIYILAQPIKTELQLADWQLGLMGGLTFAIFYATLGLPIARLAERKSRVAIISAATGVWSIMTALCGVAQNFTQLLLCRIGVGIGEAGCSPPAHSLISDYFPVERRATALSVFSFGVPLGALLGAAFGGWAAEELGWRTAMIAVGLPGLVLALIAWTTLREPPRGHSEVVPDAIATAQATGAGLELPAEPETATLGQVARRLFGRWTFIHVALGAALASFAGYGIGQFSAAYFMRAFGLDLQTVGVVIGVIGGVAAAFGTLAGGVLTDWAGRHDRRWYVWIPAIGLILSCPLYVTGYLVDDWHLATGILAIAAVLHYPFLGPSFAVTHAMVQPRMRATASALLVLVITLIGLGLGPLLVGLGGDILAAQTFADLGIDGAFSQLCPGGAAPAGSDATLAAACAQASAEGIQWAIVLCALVYGWAGLHYALASRSLIADAEP